MTAVTQFCGIDHRHLVAQKPADRRARQGIVRAAEHEGVDSLRHERREILPNDFLSDRPVEPPFLDRGEKADKPAPSRATPDRAPGLPARRHRS